VNKHFEDATYYLKRAGETNTAGLGEELEPRRERIDDLVDREEDEPEPGRVEAGREELRELQAKAEGRTRAAIGKARDRLAAHREQRVDQQG
jgi:hypothetical protein